MTNTISSVEEFVLNQYSEIPADSQDVLDLMIEFAALHVKLALKAALVSALECQDKYGYIDEKSILNAYPETMIK